MQNLLAFLGRWAPPAIIVTCGIVGWHIAHWVGLIIGLVLGIPLALVSWCGIYYVAVRVDLKQRRHAMSLTATEDLKKIVSDPSSGNLGFAMEELRRRGIKSRPSLDAMCELLVSDDSRRRGLAMSLFSAIYPELWSRCVVTGWSNMDSPEIWKSRVAIIRSEKLPGTAG